MRDLFTDPTKNFIISMDPSFATFKVKFNDHIVVSLASNNSLLALDDINRAANGIPEFERLSKDNMSIFTFPNGMAELAVLDGRLDGMDSFITEKFIPEDGDYCFDGQVLFYVDTKQFVEILAKVQAYVDNKEKEVI